MAGATIVFCDIVGFSELNNDDQKALIYKLNGEVTHELFPHLTSIHSLPDVISLPTGDGMALSFIDKEQSWGPVLFGLLDRLMRWAVENSALRIGVHVGQVSVITDINRRANVCGATINVCQRIMDAAHPNQVLFSQDAVLQYVGHGAKRYSGPPFSNESPSLFTGPTNITSKHGLSTKVHVMYRERESEGESGWVRTEPYPSGVVVGKEERTAFIVKALEALLQEPERRLLICEQSAFSTFGIPDRRIREGQPGYGRKYLALLERQRLLLDQLARREQTELKLIVRPESVQNSLHRRKALLEWLSDPEIYSKSNIEVVSGDYQGPNTLMAEGAFSISGYKLHRTAGYEMSIVHYSKHQIEEALQNFLLSFEKAREVGGNKVSVVEELKE